MDVALVPRQGESSAQSQRRFVRLRPLVSVIVPTLNDPDNKLGNYSVIINNGTLSITAAPLTVTPASLTRIYNAPNPTLTGVVEQTWVSGERRL